MRRVSGSDQTLFRGGWRSCAVVTAIQSTQNEVTGQPIWSSRLSGVGPRNAAENGNACTVRAGILWNKRSGELVSTHAGAETAAHLELYEVR